MKRKATKDFTEDEKNWMNTIAVNYCIAQADGFQLGYAQALSDFTEYITDYWNGSDDKPQKSILDAIADLGVELGNRKNVAKDNLEKAKEMGFVGYYQWNAVFEGKRTCVVRLFTKDFDDNGETEEEPIHEDSTAQTDGSGT